MLNFRKVYILLLLLLLLLQLLLFTLLYNFRTNYLQQRKGRRVWTVVTAANQEGALQVFWLFASCSRSGSQTTAFRHIFIRVKPNHPVLCCSKEDQKAGLRELQPPGDGRQHQSAGGGPHQEGAGASPGAFLNRTCSLRYQPVEPWLYDDAGSIHCHIVFFYWHNKLSGLLSKHVGLWLFVQMHHIKKITLRKQH